MNLLCCASKKTLEAKTLHRVSQLGGAKVRYGLSKDQDEEG